MKFKNPLFLLNITLFIQSVFFSVAEADFTQPFTIKSEAMELRVEQVADNFSIPWGMAFISKNKLLITERNGSVYLFNLADAKRIKLSNTPSVLAAGQGGMLDVALSPDYPETGWVYFTYVKAVDGKGATVLGRGRLDDEQSGFSEWQELLVTKSTSGASHHFGSRIAFDDSGHLFFGIGDRGERDYAQNLNNHAGTILRLNLDGSVPDDNPFVNNKNALPEIWSYGHRNPQGLYFDQQHNRLWEIEHGPRGGDEINLILAGKNYGWPVISYGKEYWAPIAVGEGTHREGMQQPVKVYDPSIAPGSLIVYSGQAFPQWQGNLIAGALILQHINRVVLDKDGKAVKEERLLESLNERIRALAQSPEGWLYFSTDSGKIFRIRD